MKTRSYSKRIQTIGIISLTTLAIGACGSPDDEDASNVELSLSWWGSDTRHQATEEIVAAFEEQHPEISIATEYSDWGGYWDGLAVQASGGDMPDIMQFSNPYLREYADRDTLLDLSSVETDQIDPGLLETGNIGDRQVGIPVGSNVLAFAANEALFEEAGVELPDDTTWTWDDLMEISKEISQSIDGYGVGSLVQEGTLEIWLRQRGEELTNANDEVGFEAETATEYFDYILEMSQSGGMPEASIISEQQSGPEDQTLIRTNRSALGTAWNQQLGLLTDATGNEFSLLRYPSPTGEAEDAQMFNNASMYFSAAASTEHPEEVQQFIDFMVNSEEANQINLSERGFPANTEMLEMIQSELTEPEQAAAEYASEIEGELGDSRPIPPLGLDGIQGLIYDAELQVLFEELTPQEAAEKLISDMERDMR